MSMLHHHWLDDEPESVGGMLLGARAGSWGISSRSDPRWNVSGRSDCIMVIAGLPSEARDALEARDVELGERPDDLEYWVHKD